MMMNYGVNSVSLFILNKFILFKWDVKLDLFVK